MPRYGKFVAPSNKLMKAPKIAVRARKLRTPVVTPYEDVTPLPGQNKPETIISLALDELKIMHIPQQRFGGGGILGGAKADQYLPDYRMVLLYNGPFHGTTEGAARDLLTEQTYSIRGLKVVKLFAYDLPRIKPRLLEVIGRPIA